MQITNSTHELVAPVPSCTSLLHFPPELISQILILYKEGLPPLCHTVETVNHEFPHFEAGQLLRLGSISHRLRTIAWSTPQLWSHVYIRLSDQPLRCNAQITALASWLARSSYCPVTIKLHTSVIKSNFYGDLSSSSVAEGSAVLSAMQVILAHSFHWKEVHLSLPYTDYPFFIEYIRLNRIPYLKRLTFLFYDACQSNQEIQEFSPLPLANVPSLTDVGVIELPFSSSQTAMASLPWEQITRFHLSGLILDSVLKVLQKSINLTSCTLAVKTGQPFTDGPITHFALRTLTLERTSIPLKYLTLPALKKLNIEATRIFPAEQFSEFIMRSGCKLTSLSISVEFMAATSLVSCLRDTPELEDLKIHNMEDRVHTLFGNFLIKQLTLEDNTKILVPHLRRLEVLGCPVAFDFESLGTMLRSRWDVVEVKETNVRRLERFCLEATEDTPPTWDNIFSSVVSELVKDGMHVCVRHYQHQDLCVLRFE